MGSAFSSIFRHAPTSSSSRPCAACTTACPSFWANDQFVGPAAIVNAHRFIFDSRDRAGRERLDILNSKTGVWRCRTIYNCTVACPREIQITKAIGEVKQAILYGEIDLGMIPFAKFFADSAGHYARPDVFSFGIDGRAQTPITGAPEGAVDHWHIIGTPDDAQEIVDGDTEPRLLTPPSAG